MFDGSIERVKCITEHDDFAPMTNKTVLLQVGPLLRDKNGRLLIVCKMTGQTRLPLVA